MPFYLATKRVHSGFFWLRNMFVLALNVSLASGRVHSGFDHFIWPLYVFILASNTPFGPLNLVWPPNVFTPAFSSYWKCSFWLQKIVFAAERVHFVFHHFIWPPKCSFQLYLTTGHVHFGFKHSFWLLNVFISAFPGYWTGSFWLQIFHLSLYVFLLDLTIKSDS